MTTYITQAPAHAGGSIIMGAAGGATGDLAPTGTGIGLLVQWGTANGGTVTLPIVNTYDGLGVSSRVLSCLPGSINLIPLPSAVYGVGTTAVNYNTTSNLTVASIQVAT